MYSCCLFPIYPCKKAQAQSDWMECNYEHQSWHHATAYLIWFRPGLWLCNCNTAIYLSHGLVAFTPYLGLCQGFLLICHVFNSIHLPMILINCFAPSEERHSHSIILPPPGQKMWCVQDDEQSQFFPTYSVLPTGQNCTFSSFSDQNTFHISASFRQDLDWCANGFLP